MNDFYVLNSNEIVYNTLKESKIEYKDNPYVIFIQNINKKSPLYELIIAIEEVTFDFQIQYSIAMYPKKSQSYYFTLKNEIDSFVSSAVLRILQDKYEKDNNRKTNTEESSI